MFAVGAVSGQDKGNMRPGHVRTASYGNNHHINPGASYAKKHTFQTSQGISLKKAATIFDNQHNPQRQKKSMHAPKKQGGTQSRAVKDAHAANGTHQAGLQNFLRAQTVHGSQRSYTSQTQPSAASLRIDGVNSVIEQQPLQMQT